MTPHTLIASLLVLLAAGTGLAWPQYPVWTPPAGTLWPGETIPTFPAKPVKPIIYAPGLTQEGFENRWHPVWELMARQAQAQAEAVPLPPERPRAAPLPDPSNTWPVEQGALKHIPRRAEVRAGDICARHNLKKTYITKWTWRCLP